MEFRSLGRHGPYRPQLQVEKQGETFPLRPHLPILCHPPDTECMAVLKLNQKSAECGRRALKSVCCLATEFNMSFYNG